MAAEGSFFKVLVGGFLIDGQELHSIGRQQGRLPIGSSLQVGCTLEKHTLRARPRFQRRVEQTNDDPSIRMRGHGPNKKMGIVFVGHFGFVALPEFRLPRIAVL